MQVKKTIKKALLTAFRSGFDIEACTNLDIAPELKEWLVNLMNSPAPSTEVCLFKICYFIYQASRKYVLSYNLKNVTNLCLVVFPHYTSSIVSPSLCDLTAVFIHLSSIHLLQFIAKFSAQT